MAFPTDTYPTHCASCGREPEGRDNLKPEYPYCFSCHFGGRGFDHTHAEALAVLRAYGLHSRFYHTGGGCWILAITRGPEWRDYEDEEGAFTPYISASDCYETKPGEWSTDAGVPEDPGGPWGAFFIPTATHAESWEGDDGSVPLEVCPTDAHGLAQFALQHLPAITTNQES